MSWIAVAPAILVAAAVVLLPGLLVAAALRLRGLTALALAGPLGYGLLGVSGVLAGLAGLRFSWVAPVVLGVIVAVVVVVVRMLLTRRGRALPAWDSWAPAGVLPVAGAAIVAAIVVGVLAFGAVPTPDRISQTYDAVFHLNAAESIVQSGNASSLQLYRLVNPGKTYAFYPAVWHSLVAITAEVAGVSVPVATNAAWLATAGPVFALGCGFLAATLFGGSGVGRGAAAPAQRTLVAAAAALLASAFTAFPYLLLDFGTLYPNGLAYTMLPSGFALLALVAPWAPGAPFAPAAPGRIRVLVVLGAWVVGAAFTHPRSLVGLVVLALPLAVAWFAGRIRHTAASGAGGRRRARLIVGGVVGVAVLLVAGLSAFVLHYYDVGSRPISDHLNGAPAQARESFGAALVQGLLSTSLVSPSQKSLPIPIVLGVVVLVGLVALLLTRGLRWAAVSYLAVALLYACAAGSDSDLAKILTGLWDKDKFRIVALLPTIAAPIAAWTLVAGGAAAVRLVRRGLERRRAGAVSAPRPAVPVLVGVVAVVLVAGSAWAGPALTQMRGTVGHVFSLPSSAKHGLLVTGDETTLLASVGRYVPEGQVIIDNPWNGSALAWSLGGREVLFPHLGGYWGKSRLTIAKHLNAYETNPKVCKAVHKLDLHWVVAAKGHLHGGKKVSKTWRGIDKAVEGDGVVRVAKVGSASLYRLTACWP